MQSFIFLQANPAGEPSGMLNIVFIVAIFVIFYFFMIRPQNKKRKQLNEMRSSLKKGDNIITVGGIHGKVTEVKETTIVISVDANTKLKVDKTSVSMDASTKLTEETKA